MTLPIRDDIMDSSTMINRSLAHGMVELSDYGSVWNVSKFFARNAHGILVSAFVCLESLSNCRELAGLLSDCLHSVSCLLTISLFIGMVDSLCNLVSSPCSIEAITKSVLKLAIRFVMFSALYIKSLSYVCPVNQIVLGVVDLFIILSRVNFTFLYGDLMGKYDQMEENVVEPCRIAVHFRLFSSFLKIPLILGMVSSIGLVIAGVALSIFFELIEFIFVMESQTNLIDAALSIAPSA